MTTHDKLDLTYRLSVALFMASAVLYGWADMRHDRKVNARLIELEARVGVNR